MVIYLVSALGIAGLLLIRLLEPATARARAHPVWAALVAVALVAGGFWTVLGPLQADWNASANNGAGSGARIVVAGASASSTATPAAGDASAFSRAFSAQLRGSFSQRGPDANGTVSYEIQGTLRNGATGQLDLRLSGQDDGSGSGSGDVSITTTSVTLGTATNPALYAGQVTQVQSDGSRWSITATLTESGAGSPSLTITLSLGVSDGTVRGSIQGTPVTGTG